MVKTFRESLCAGILIAIGGSVFLACDDRYAGAVFFSVALLCICCKGYYLFTGKIGYLSEDCSGKNLLTLLVGLAGNLLATYLLGLLIRFAIPALGEKAASLVSGKLSQTFPSTLIRACFCGILMYLAVNIYRDKKSIAAILFCVPVFILSGFEHSIADMFYFGAGACSLGKTLPYILTVVLGNSLGGVLLPLLKGKEK